MPRRLSQPASACSALPRGRVGVQPALRYHARSSSPSSRTASGLLTGTGVSRHQGMILEHGGLEDSAGDVAACPIGRRDSVKVEPRAPPHRHDAGSLGQLLIATSRSCSHWSEVAHSMGGGVPKDLVEVGLEMRANKMRCCGVNLSSFCCLQALGSGGRVHQCHPRRFPRHIRR